MSAPGNHTASFEDRPGLGGRVRHDGAHPGPVPAALERARKCLLGKQQPDGHWCAELQGDTILESEYILLMAFLGRERDPKCLKAAEYLLEQQGEDGGWSNYPGGPSDVTVSVKAYFALKLTGHRPDAPHMARARDVILALGGAEACNSFTRFYLALLGELPYDDCPAVPPEMIFLPRWAPFNPYSMSSWTRTIVIPLSIFYAHKPVRQLPPGEGIAELFLDAPRRPPAQQFQRRALTWHNFFLCVDRALKLVDPRKSSFPADGIPAALGPRLRMLLREPFTYLRTLAVHRCARWMLERFEDSDGVGAIFPPMVYTVICLKCLGYADDSPEMTWAMKQLDDLMIEEDGRLRLQPCFSPVWDTAIAVNALSMADHAGQGGAVRRSVDWLLAKEVRRRGDWSVMNPQLEAGGWFFEYNNAFYPDVDDTAMVLMGLARTGHAFTGPVPAAATPEESREKQIPAVRRAVAWLLGMQNTDGGWAAFDRDINNHVMEQVPFADHNAMLDPSCPDITARSLESLGQYGYQAGHPVVERAVAFIRRTQDPRGCWVGRWGVNYIYGTWQVLAGLEAVGFDRDDPMVRRAVAWLKSVQQPCGGWGETCRSYDDPSLAGQGTPTASQTGWALLGLMAAGEAHAPEVRAGIDYLVSTQSADGNWEETPFTGTGFPKVFYLKYHYYRLYFPLMALARYCNSVPVPANGRAAANVHAAGHSRRSHHLRGDAVAAEG